MKDRSVNRLSILSALLIAVLSVFLLRIPFEEPPHVKIPLMLLLPAAVLVVVFFLSRLVLKKVYTRQQWSEISKEEVEKLRGEENYRKEFLGNVYHELKTPIFNIQGYILTLLEGGLEDESINRVYLERSEKNINRMISIVEDLESISGLESGALNLKIQDFNIKKLIDDVCEANEMRALKHKIRLDVARIKESDQWVSGDRKRIYQVLNNLVINSIHYGYTGGKTLISVSRAGEKVLVEVKDNGIGISRQDMPRIFERFYRVDKSRSRDSGGTGLGLAIVKHIIEAHNETVSVDSAPGKGSIFRFTLAKA
ncbi:MAG: ATP-binding protein [Marinilabiliaceae bacterium]|jgi:two-component system phosphate regulon sensor histidine kinase PhoR|nr:ATP-binding protein [Marinilabiliaceae bacterium]